MWSVSPARCPAHGWSRGTRIPLDPAHDNAEDGHSPEDIVAAICPSLPRDRARRSLADARERADVPRPA